MNYVRSCLVGVVLASVLAISGLQTAGVRAAAPAALGDWQLIGPANGGLVAITTTSGIDPTLIVSDLVNGLQRSADGGASWTASGSGIPAGSAIVALTISPASDSLLLAGGDGVYRSTDGGLSWTAGVGIGGSIFVRAIAFNPSNPLIAYAGTDGNGLYRSTDGGGSWLAASLGLDPNIRSIAIDPLTPTTLLAGTANGLYRSTNSAATWTPVGAGLPGASKLNALAYNPADPRQVLIGSGAGVYHSSNGGLSVTKLNAGAVNEQRVNAVSVRPDAPSSLFVATASQGVFSSNDGGATWAATNSGLSDLNTQMFAVNLKLPQLLYVATLGGGAAVYNRTALLQTDPNSGGPGSAFRFEAAFFAATTPLTITVNGTVITAPLSSSASGRATFVLGTSSTVAPGSYVVRVSGGGSTATSVFRIVAGGAAVSAPAGSPATITLTDVGALSAEVFVPALHR